MWSETYDLTGYVHSDCIDGSVWPFKEAILAYCHRRASGHVERKQWDPTVRKLSQYVQCA
jgi:hypothetical protein